MTATEIPLGTALRIVVRDDPAPQGSKRHVGNGRMIEQSKKVAPWREAVKTAAISWVQDRYRGGKTYDDDVTFPLTGPVGVLVVFTLHKPLSAPKTRRTWPARRPDLDKLVRSTFDALGAAGVWRDDGQVVELHAHKRYPGEGIDALATPGAVIYIAEVTS